VVTTTHQLLGWGRAGKEKGKHVTKPGIMNTI
jgi:hypothetical protein